MLVSGPSRRSRVGVPGRLGAAVRRLLGAPADADAGRRLGSTMVAGAGSALVDLRLGVVVVIAMQIRPILARRRERLGLESSVVRELPEVIDLVRLALASGGSVLLALRAVSADPVGPVSRALGRAVAGVEAGHRMADALDELPSSLGEPVRPLIRALVASERYGIELGSTLGRLADDARDDRRRRAQTQARRVPIRMLLPLVLCILPAFVLLTLVPTLVATFDTLDL